MLLRVVPNPIIGVLVRTGKLEHRYTQRDGHEKTEDIGVVWPQAEKRQGWPATKRSWKRPGVFIGAF